MSSTPRRRRRSSSISGRRGAARASSWGRRWKRRCKDARGAVKLVKINVDENQELAAQMRIQSIPAVYAFKDGRPVDGFVGALPESQVKQFVAKLAPAARPAPSPVAEALALGQGSASPPATRRAPTNIFTQILEHEPGNVDAIAGLTRSAIARKDLKAAKATSRRRAGRAGRQPRRDRGGARRARAGRGRREGAGAIGELQARLEADPQDHQARLDLAAALFAAGERERRSTSCSISCAATANGTSRRRASSSSNSSRRSGSADPLTVEARKRLSSILFS